MSSPYVKLGNRTLDQWKVTELREELKRRKLATKGLKEELVKRLDEAVRFELANAKDEEENDEDDTDQSELSPEHEKPEADVCEGGKSFTEVGISMDEKADSKPEHPDDHESLFEGKVEVSLDKATELERGTDSQPAAVETTVVVSETEYAEVETKLPVINENSMPLEPSGGPGLEDSGALGEALNPSVQMETDDPKYPETDSGVQPLKHQVPEVDTDLGFQVKCDSASTESVSITEKVGFKVDVITDNVPSEPSNAVPDGGESHPLDVEEPLVVKETEEPLDKKDIDDTLNKKAVNEPLEKKVVEGPPDENVSAQFTGGNNEEMVGSLKHIDGEDLVYEKLNLDRSSGDDSMEEDIVESKIDENVEKSSGPALKEEDNVDVVSHDKAVKTRPAKAEIETVFTAASVKRKFHDIPEKPSVGNNDNEKKARRLNAEGLKSEGPHSTKVISLSPKGLSEPAFKPLSGTDPAVPVEVTKERIVPPSVKAPTNSLRIDRFLRPFTLKQVQELLGKTGNVTGFWMDHIKTHCYVSFSSVEEAVNTRNAVYNLQWPANGGRQLVAEFVDPHEVITRVEAPPPSPATPLVPPQPSPRQQVPRHQQLPPPPPPPLANPPPLPRDHRLHRETLPPRDHPIPARERLNNLPPPPPPLLAEKPEPPIITLDDLFRKTKAIPRIYYLPLSDEEVAAKTKEQGKNVLTQ